MSRLTDLEAEVEALRMLVGDLSDAVNTKEPKEDPADKDAKVDKPDREEVKKDQEDIGFNELLRQQEEANELSALERFRTGPSALEDFNNETRRRRAEQEEFFNSKLLEEVLGEDPEAVKGEVQEITKDEKPKADRKPVVIDPKGSGKTQELRTNAQPGFISLKAEDSSGDYANFEVLGLKTGLTTAPTTSTTIFPFKLEKVTVNGTDKIRVHKGKLYSRVDTCTMSIQTVLTAASTSYHATEKTDGQSGRPNLNHTHTVGGYTDNTTLSGVSGSEHLHVLGSSVTVTPAPFPNLVNSTSTSTIFKTTGQAVAPTPTETDYSTSDLNHATGKIYAKWEVTINTSAAITGVTLSVERVAENAAVPSDTPFGALTEGSGTLTRANTAARTGTFYREIGVVSSSSVTQIMHDNVHWSMFVLPEVS